MVAKMVRTGVAADAREIVCKRKDGSDVPLFVTYAVTQRAGDEIEFFCLDIDMTERKRVEALKASLEVQLRQSQKMEAIGTLAGGIAHDVQQHSRHDTWQCGTGTSGRNQGPRSGHQSG